MLLEHGYKVTAIDNLDNAFEEVYRRLKKLAGDNAANLDFVKVNSIAQVTDNRLSYLQRELCPVLAGGNSTY